MWTNLTAMKHSLPGYVTRGQEFLTLLTERILVLDGAMGTMIQQRTWSRRTSAAPTSRAATRTSSSPGPTSSATSTRRTSPRAADIVETNSFGGTPIVLAEYGLRDRAMELNEAAARVAREAAAKFSGPRFVAGSMGPTTKTITVTGGITFARARSRTSTSRRWACCAAASTASSSRPRRTPAT